ncbi:hypothetical protein, partial [Streptomyces graminilatus]|uniref:hypothetical protein n=1 Tax=Streptomyces graminilatus TaxID=1464070 RepID=UPI0006E33CB4
MKVPKRVWGEGRYSPGAVAWHAQITALQKRPERCRASVDRLAGYMGDGKRTGERYLAELSAPGPDGVPELTTIRHTDPSGDGETAERCTRHVRADEHFALVPVLAAKALRHPLFVLYCALTYAVDTKTPVTAAELAALLGVTEMTARSMTRELDRLGWITVHHRAGAHGRHEYDVHDHPLRPVPSPPEDPSSNGGSGASADGGSLATKEDPVLTDDENNTPPVGVSAVGELTVSVRGPGDVLPETFRSAPEPRPYGGPALRISPRVREVLAPVADLLPAVNTFVIRKASREIGRQLDAGIPSDDLHDQILNRRARTGAANLRDPGRWLLGVALAPSPCGLTDCVDGFMIHTDAPCKTCAEQPHRHRRPGVAAPEAPPAPE